MIGRAFWAMTAGAVLAAASGWAATEVITVTTFHPDERGCAGTQPLRALESTFEQIGDPVAQSRCQPQPPLYPGTASQEASADEQGNLSVEAAANLGTPVLLEEAWSSAAATTEYLTLTGPATSIDIEAVIDIGSLTTSSVDGNQALLGDAAFSLLTVAAQGFYLCANTEGEFDAVSSNELEFVGSVNGSVGPTGELVYRTTITCADGESVGTDPESPGLVRVFGFLLAQAVSQSTAEMTAAGSVRVRSVTFTLHYE